MWIKKSVISFFWIQNSSDFGRFLFQFPRDFDWFFCYPDPQYFFAFLNSIFNNAILSQVNQCPVI